MTVGRTKFTPDKLFSCITKAFYNSDVYCIEMLDHTAQQHASSFVLTSRLMLHWKAALEFNYSAVPGITGIHDILISKKSGKVISYRDTCFNGEYTIYTTTNMILNNYPPRLRLRINQLNSAEKLRQLSNTGGTLSKIFLYTQFLPFFS